MTFEERKTIKEARKHMYFVIPVIDNPLCDEQISEVHDYVDNHYIITTVEKPTWYNLNQMAENGVLLALERGETVYGPGITGERTGCIGIPNTLEAICTVLGIDETPRQKHLDEEKTAQ